MARRSRISGRSKLRSKLSKILPAEVKKEVQDAIGHAAKIIFDDAERNIPVDSGDLKDSIKLQHRGDKLGAKIGFWKKGNLRNWRKAGWRAHFVEFGTRGTRNIKNKNRFSLSQNFGRKRVKITVKPQKAHPFLGPAYLKNQHRVKSMIDHAVDRALKRTANGS